MITCTPNGGMDRNKEYIVAAAYRIVESCYTRPCVVKDKTVRKSENDWDDITTIEIGRCHADIIRRHGAKLVQDDGGGFYTNFGRYVSREEAYEIALANNQIDPAKTCDRPGGLMKPRLFSEDIFWSY